MNERCDKRKIKGDSSSSAKGRRHKEDVIWEMIGCWEVPKVVVHVNRTGNVCMYVCTAILCILSYGHFLFCCCSNVVLLSADELSSCLENNLQSECQMKSNHFFKKH